MCPGQPSWCNWWFWWNGDALVRWSGLRRTSREEYKDQQNKCKYQIQIQGPEKYKHKYKDQYTNTKKRAPEKRLCHFMNTSWHKRKHCQKHAPKISPIPISVWLLLVETNLNISEETNFDQGLLQAGKHSKSNMATMHFKCKLSETS